MRTLPALEAAEEKPCAPRRSLETFRMAAHPAKFAGEGQGAQQREVTLKVSDDTCEKHPTWKQVSAEQCQSPPQLARRTYCLPPQLQASTQKTHSDSMSNTFVIAGQPMATLATLNVLSHLHPVRHAVQGQGEKGPERQCGEEEARQRPDILGEK